MTNDKLERRSQERPTKIGTHLGRGRGIDGRPLTDKSGIKITVKVLTKVFFLFFHTFYKIN